jgi:pimeloyl-ACP methyl ester carboxylesterase
MVLAVAAAALAMSAHAPTLLLTPCDVQSVPAGCGTLRVPEDRARPAGRTIELRVVVVPARHQPAPAHAFAYLTGGPGGAATAETYEVVTAFAAVHDRQDILLVDQRGTGGSHPLDCRPAPGGAAALRACATAAEGDVRRYGTRAAADDLDAVRAALGYDRLDVYGVSYGATLAQVYLRRHRGRVRTLVLDGATFLDVPFLDGYAPNAQRALDGLAHRCAAASGCARAFPRWEATLTRLVRHWDERPVRLSRSRSLDGDGLAGIVHDMLLDPQTAAAIPYVVTRAGAGDLRPLARQAAPGTRSGQLVFWSIWCDEPWVGLGAGGPWHTLFDGWTRRLLAGYRAACRGLPHRPEPAAAWHLPRTQVPLLLLAGGADPQDPLANAAGLRWFFPRGRAVVVPGLGHGVGSYGCLGGLVSLFVDRADAAGLDTRCVRAVRPPPFVSG